MDDHYKAWLGLPSDLKPPSAAHFVEYRLSKFASKPTYRIDARSVRFLEEVPPKSEPLRGRIVDGQGWLKICNALRYEYDSPGHSLEYSSPDTLDTEPYFCAELNLLLVLPCVRTPTGDIKLPAPMLHCPGCGTEDMGKRRLGSAKNAPVKQRSHCGPILPFPKLLHPDPSYKRENRRGPCGDMRDELPSLKGMIIDRSTVPPLSSTLASSPFAEHANKEEFVRLRQEIAAASEADSASARLLELIIIDGMNPSGTPVERLNRLHAEM